MQKLKRLLAIENIIESEIISSQEALLNKLKGKGIICTQATLSRNLRQLGVSRIPDRGGNYRYALAARKGEKHESGERLNIINVILEIVEAKGLMVIRTIPGNANATAYYIDNAQRYEIAGTIAGDDTILIIPRNGITLRQVHTCLEIILPGLHDRIKLQIAPGENSVIVTNKRNRKQ
jgi:transcriptional regulator of arginine metabolism